MSNDLKSEVNRRKRSKNDSQEKLSLAPLDFETAIRAAMATGKPPKAVPAPKKRRPKPKK